MTFTRLTAAIATAIALSAAMPASSFGHAGSEEIQQKPPVIEAKSIGLTLLRFGPPEEVAIKWTPVKGKWVACTVNGMKCKCRGHVADCRAATPPKKKANGTANSATKIRSQAEKRLEQQRKDLTRNWAG